MEEQLHLLTGAYALNAVNDIDRAAFEKHALEDPQTRQEARELSETAALLAYAVEPETPPAHLKADVMAAIRNTRQLPASAVSRDVPQTLSSSRPQSRTRPGNRTTARTRPGGRPHLTVLRGLAAAAAVLLIVAGGVGGWAIGQNSGQTSAAKQINQFETQQQAVAAIMASPDVKLASSKLGDGAVVTVASSASVDRAAVSVHGIPPLPSDKTYEMWFISAKGAVPAGLMTAPGEGAPGLLVLTGNIDGATHVGITVEPAGGSAQPTTTPILVQAI
jgi:anti-sigma-K factor RskA